MKQLDARLLKAASMVPLCDMGADIGADHGLLACHLLRQGICQRMIVSDISPSALAHAGALIRAEGLEGSTEVVLADGLNALTVPVQAVCMLGMGGRLEAAILKRGKARLQGASIILSAHTEQADIRQAVMDIGYRIVREEVVFCAGRFYLVWKAEPGMDELDAWQLCHGTPLLLAQRGDLMAAYWAHRAEVIAAKLAGLCAASQPDQAAIAEAEEELQAMQQLHKEALA